MASIKMLCIVFILTLFGEIRATVDSDASAAPKHVPVHQVLPPSLLYLLHSRPIGRSQPSPVANAPTSLQNPVSNDYPRLPTAPVPLMAPAVPWVPEPVAPWVPVPPTPPVAPRAPVPPTPPVAPVPPSLPRVPSSGSGTSSGKHVSVHHMLPPSILYLLNHRPIRRPLPSQPAKPVPSTPQNPPAEPLPAVLPSAIYPPRVPQTLNPLPPSLPPGQLSYDNPSNGNRKVLNVVHVPLKQEDPKPLTAVNTPLGPAPLPAVIPNTSQGEDLSPVPSDTTGSLPIPEKPSSGKAEPSDSTNTITLNPKDIPVQPANSIEASPIPVKTNNDNKPEDLSPTPNDDIKASPIPSQPNDTNENKSDESPNTSSQEDFTGNTSPSQSEAGVEESSDSANTITINPKDLPVQPPNSIEASPIPVRTNNDIKPEDLSLKSNDSEIASPIPSQASDTNENKSDEQGIEESNDPQGTTSFSPKDIPYQPISNIEASPIPVRSNDDAAKESKSDDSSNVLAQEPPTSIASSTPGEVNQDDVSKDDSEKNNSSENKPEENNDSDAKSSENSGEVQNPLGNLILNGTSSDVNKNTQDGGSQDNPLKNVVLNGTSSNASTEPPQDNPLKDLIVNDTTANKSGEDKNYSAEESSNEAKSESSQEQNEEANNGSSQNSASNKEENSEVSSNNSAGSSGSNESSNVSSEESDSSHAE